jgi:hypothetical protein
MDLEVELEGQLPVLDFPLGRAKKKIQRTQSSCALANLEVLCQTLVPEPVNRAPTNQGLVDDSDLAAPRSR